MRQAIIAGNWKMYGSKVQLKALLDGLLSGYSQQLDAQLIVFPPYIYMEQVEAALSGSAIAWGAQNVSANQPGAFTGEVSADMLKDFNCDYVLVGHSERRTLYFEDDVLVAMKFAQACQHGLRPILCVGETHAEHEQNQTEAVIARQLDAVLNLESGVEGLRNAVIAYEPVWAIGTGLTATPEQAQEVHAFIREKISALSTEVAEKLPILYGGSVKASNSSALFAMPDIDGGLIGGASLDPEQFLEIAQCSN